MTIASFILLLLPCLFAVLTRAFILASTVVKGSTDIIFSVDSDFTINMWTCADSNETNSNAYKKSPIMMEDGSTLRVNSANPIISAATTVNNTAEQTHIFFIHSNLNTLAEIFRNTTDPAANWTYGQITLQNLKVAPNTPLTCTLSQQPGTAPQQPQPQQGEVQTSKRGVADVDVGVDVSTTETQTRSRTFRGKPRSLPRLELRSSTTESSSSSSLEERSPQTLNSAGHPIGQSTGQILKVYYQSPEQRGTDFCVAYIDTSSYDVFSWRMVQMPF